MWLSKVFTTLAAKYQWVAWQPGVTAEEHAALLSRIRSAVALERARDTLEAKRSAPTPEIDSGSTTTVSLGTARYTEWPAPRLGRAPNPHGLYHYRDWTAEHWQLLIDEDSEAYWYHNYYCQSAMLSTEEWASYAAENEEAYTYMITMFTSVWSLGHLPGNDMFAKLEAGVPLQLERISERGASSRSCSGAQSPAQMSVAGRCSQEDGAAIDAYLVDEVRLCASECCSPSRRSSSSGSVGSELADMRELVSIEISEDFACAYDTSVGKGQEAADAHGEESLDFDAPRTPEAVRGEAPPSSPLAVDSCVQAAQKTGPWAQVRAKAAETKAVLARARAALAEAEVLAAARDHAAAR